MTSPKVIYGIVDLSFSELVFFIAQHPPPTPPYLSIQHPAAFLSVLPSLCLCLIQHLIRNPSHEPEYLIFSLISSIILSTCHICCNVFILFSFQMKFQSLWIDQFCYHIHTSFLIFGKTPKHILQQYICHTCVMNTHFINDKKSYKTSVLELNFFLHILYSASITLNIIFHPKNLKIEPESYINTDKCTHQHFRIKIINLNLNRRIFIKSILF